MSALEPAASLVRRALRLALASAPLLAAAACSGGTEQGPGASPDGGEPGPRSPSSGAAAPSPVADAASPSSGTQGTEDSGGTEDGGTAGAPRVPVGARFLARLELALAGKPTGLLAEDLDGDGHVDLVAAAREPGALVSWWGSAEGPRVPPRSAPVPDWPLGPVGLGAVGSGRALVAVASQVTGEVVAFGIGADGELEPAWTRALADPPQALAAGDVGADGTPDVVVATRTTLVWIPLVDGAPGAVRQRSLGAERPTCLRVLADGRIAVGFQVPRSIEVHPPDETSAAVTHPLPGIPRALLDADLDGDGDDELVVTGGDRDVWAFGYGDPSGAAAWSSAAAVPRAFRTPGLVPLRMQRADLNRDGSPELVLLHNHSLDFGVLGDFGPEGPALTLRPLTNVGQTPVDLALADLDGDGRVDLAVANRDARRVSFLRGTGFAAPDRVVFYAAFQTPTGSDPVDVVAVDLTGDGAPEAVSLDAVDETLTVLSNEYGLLRKPSRVELGAGARRIAAGDFDGDGNADLAVLFERADRAYVRVLRGDGASGLDALGAQEFAAGRSGADLLVCDLGADGRDDVVTADPAGERLWWLGSGQGGDPGGTPFAEPRPIEIGQAPLALSRLRPDAAGGVGRLALAFEEPGAGAGLALVAPEAGFRVDVLPGRIPGLRPVDLAAGDLDGDGREDLLALLRAPEDSAGGRVATFLAGDGPAASFAPGPRVETGALPRCLAAGDLDGDGRSDAVVAAQNSHHVNVWLARGEPLRLERQADLGAHLGPTRLTLADLDGDGHLDVLVANTFSDDVSAIYNVPAR